MGLSVITFLNSHLYFEFYRSSQSMNSDNRKKKPITSKLVGSYKHYLHIIMLRKTSRASYVSFNYLINYNYQEMNVYNLSQSARVVDKRIH